MIQLHNKLENKTIFEGNERDFIYFVKQMVIENETSDFSVLGLSDAEEYIENYCDYLELIYTE